MEKVTIKTVTPKRQGVKNGRAWTIWEVELSDGRKMDSFDTFTAGETVEVEIDVKDPKYNPTIRRTKKASDYQAVKAAETANKILNSNDEKEQRISMLSCISSACNYYHQREGSEEKVISFAKRLFELAMTKKDELPF